MSDDIIPKLIPDCKGHITIETMAKIKNKKKIERVFFLELFGELQQE